MPDPSVKPEDPVDPGIDIEDPNVPNSDNKLDDPSLDIFDPNVPSHLLQIDDSLIPQTGAVRYPIWLLNVFGTVCIAAGILQLRKADPEEFEDLDEEDMLDEEV